MKLQVPYQNLDPDNTFIAHQLVPISKGLQLTVDSFLIRPLHTQIHDGIYFIEKHSNGLPRWYRKAYISLSALFNIDTFLIRGDLIFETIPNTSFSIESKIYEDGSVFFDFRF